MIQDFLILPKNKHLIFIKNKPLYDAIVNTLEENISDKSYPSPEQFTSVITNILEVL